MIRKNDVDKGYRKRKGRIMFPTSHDIPEKSEIKRACFTVLNKLLLSENDILVTTKPRLGVIKEICEKFEDYKEQIQFRFTITSLNNDLLVFWEPGAPDFDERLTALIHAYDRKFKTSVSIEPFLDFNPIPLINKIQPYITESIWLGKMNYIRRNNLSQSEKRYYLNVRRNYEIENILKIFHKLKDIKLIMYKDSIRKLIINSNK